ncbi:MAG: hypothetical protein HYZ10_08085 [Ignavibacteriales bacterium]|nr:hypothetical protein [Ignavibacteriales bacterium]
MKQKEEHYNIGVVWYTEEEWSKIKSISSDSEIFEDSYKEWEEMALETLVDMKVTGIIGTKVFIKSDEFIVWCKIHSLPLDASSRSRYVSEIMSKRNSN